MEAIPPLDSIQLYSAMRRGPMFINATNAILQCTLIKCIAQRTALLLDDPELFFN